MSILLDNNLLARLLQANVLAGLVLLVVGILTACLAGVVTKKVRKTDKVDTSDKIYLTAKAFALATIIASLIVMIAR